ncbi:hypothetical protein [Streptacidiphilus sp. P02-A3a]|uniref:hypothetical protein n=1 Tax=Streptacidiphilus sp. P02-A3a TaxID=2704468 RepID=UPI0015F99637|nr:hypothetical protein [Streptacidiphilus sp. P02-A3a]QMU72973.1 hypothetical protein GXP74_36765 [Streptacidiphilus sp. P02-A3a]
MSDDRASNSSRSPSPSPEPIRFFGTAWVTHDTGYWLRRVAVSVGALAATVAGALLMRLGVQGVLISKSGSLVNVLLVGAVLVCTAVAAVRAWNVFTRGRASLTGWMAEDRSVGPMLAIGFVGALAVYFLRSLTEAPGEAEKRAGYERALAASRARSRPVPAGAARRRRR